MDRIDILFLYRTGANGAPVALDKADTFTGAKSRFTVCLAVPVIILLRSPLSIHLAVGRERPTLG